MSRSQFKKQRPVGTEAAICIYTPGDKPIYIKHQDWRRVHKVDFYDVDKSETEEYPIISDAQAQGMVDFIDRCVFGDSEIDTIVVQCDAGQSRSAAVAIFMKDYYNITMVQKNWTNYNRTVYNKMFAIVNKD